MEINNSALRTSKCGCNKFSFFFGQKTKISFICWNKLKSYSNKNSGRYIYLLKYITMYSYIFKSSNYGLLYASNELRLRSICFPHIFWKNFTVSHKIIYIFFLFYFSPLFHPFFRLLFISLGKFIYVKPLHRNIKREKEEPTGETTTDYC